MKWLPVYHVSTIFGNHVVAGVLWVKVTFLSACQQTKWRPDRTKFDGEIVSQTRVPPVSTPMNNLFSTPRVKTSKDWFTQCPYTGLPHYNAIFGVHRNRPCYK